MAKILSPTRFVSTTEGRKKFPDIMQETFGAKSMTGFSRYGRVLGAAVPIEAVRILAGFAGAVDPDAQKRIRNTARALLKKQPTLR